MSKSLHIVSYFSLPTDLAGEMSQWPEFVSGKGYDVDLRSPENQESVTVRYVESDEFPSVVITGSESGPLFDRVAGRVIYALSASTDSLLIKRRSPPT